MPRSKGSATSVAWKGADAVTFLGTEEIDPYHCQLGPGQSMQLAIDGEPDERPLTLDLLVEMVRSSLIYRPGPYRRPRRRDLLREDRRGTVHDDRRKNFVFDARPRTPSLLPSALTVRSRVRRSDRRGRAIARAVRPERERQ